MTTLHQAPGGFKYMERDDGLYEALMPWAWYSERYGKWIRIKDRQVRDGATWARDVVSLSWWCHDQVCADGVWADGSDVTPWQAACTVGDILRKEGRWFRATTWKYSTYLFGCKKARLEISNETETENIEQDATDV